MNYVMEYIGQNYMTLLLLAGIIVIIMANRRTKIDGMRYIWEIIGLVFMLTVFEYLEDWCITYDKPIWIRYMKSAVCYSIHPLIIILELYLIFPLRHKKMILLPYVANEILCIADLFGANFIYGFVADGNYFHPGPLHYVPVLVLFFYMLLFAYFSLGFIQKKEYSKALIVAFMTVSALLTVLLEYFNVIVEHITEMASLEILVYYFYLSAIHQTKVQENLHESQIEVEHQKVELLKAQIQPHFIYNSLMALQAKSIGNPVLYHGIENFGKYLRANFEAIGEKKLVQFKDELKCIKAYVELERINYGEKLNIEYDIEFDDFMLPALTVEPLVENAIRYGIGTYEQGGTVKIIVRDDPDYIHIEVKDDGSGGNKLTDAQKKRKGIGIENVRMRLNALNMGVLSITQDETGTSAVILLFVEGASDEDNYN